MKPRAGVLQLQGEAGAHLRALGRAGANARPVRKLDDLEGLTHLVIPGGESTTIHHLLELFGMWEPIVLRHRRGSLALFGTCAGAILLGRGDGERPPRMELLDAVVSRNAYGRQVDSFRREIHLDGLETKLKGVFIRAPKFLEVGPGARVLGWDCEDPILVEGPGLLAATFHPELSGSIELHRYFLQMAPGEATAQRNISPQSAAR